MPTSLMLFVIICLIAQSLAQILPADVPSLPLPPIARFAPPLPLGEKGFSQPEELPKDGRLGADPPSSFLLPPDERPEMELLPQGAPQTIELRLPDGIGRVEKDIECEESFKSYNGKCYHPGDRELSYEEARLHCGALNAQLTSIHGEKENKFIQTIANSKKVWIGLEKHDHRWKWADGSKVDFRNWGLQQPDKCCGTNVSCAAINSYWIGGKWFDTSCDAEHGFVCTYELTVQQMPPLLRLPDQSELPSIELPESAQQMPTLLRLPDQSELPPIELPESVRQRPVLLPPPDGSELPSIELPESPLKLQVPRIEMRITRIDDDQIPPELLPKIPKNPSPEVSNEGPAYEAGRQETENDIEDGSDREPKSDLAPDAQPAEPPKPEEKAMPLPAQLPGSKPTIQKLSPPLPPKPRICKCPPKWLTFKDDCFQINKATKVIKTAEAENQCGGKGARLAAPCTAQLKTFIEENVKKGLDFKPEDRPVIDRRFGGCFKNPDKKGPDCCHANWVFANKKLVPGMLPMVYSPVGYWHYYTQTIYSSVYVCQKSCEIEDEP